MRYSRRMFIREMALIAAAGFLAACDSGSQSGSLDPSKKGSKKPGFDPTKAAEFQVLADGLDFPEGPAFDAHGELWCTELNGGRLVKWSAGAVEKVDIDASPNSLGFDASGRVWVCDKGKNRLLRQDPASGLWETLLDSIGGEALQTPNDLCFDARGNVLFTCPNFASEERLGYVVCLSPAGEARIIGSDFYRPNGLELVDGGEALVVADTYQKKLFKGRWDVEKMKWLDPQIWAEVGGAEGPDGMAFGADGLLYQAIYGDGVVRVVAQDGQIAGEIRTPGKNPTNVAIDPSGKLGLVVTETERGQLLSYPLIQPGA